MKKFTVPTRSDMRILLAAVAVVMPEVVMPESEIDKWRPIANALNITAA